MIYLTQFIVGWNQFSRTIFKTYHYHSIWKVNCQQDYPKLLLLFDSQRMDQVSRLFFLRKSVWSGWYCLAVVYFVRLKMQEISSDRHSNTIKIHRSYFSCNHTWSQTDYYLNRLARKIIYLSKIHVQTQFHIFSINIRYS